MTWAPPSACSFCFCQIPPHLWTQMSFLQAWSDMNAAERLNKVPPGCRSATGRTICVVEQHVTPCETQPQNISNHLRHFFSPFWFIISHQGLWHFLLYTLLSLEFWIETFYDMRLAKDEKETHVFRNILFWNPKWKILVLVFHRNSTISLKYVLKIYNNIALNKAWNRDVFIQNYFEKLVALFF